jgi:peptidoglycan hydrolase-like protein with peptidoglycan-binding domain
VDSPDPDRPRDAATATSGAAIPTGGALRDDVPSLETLSEESGDRPGADASGGSRSKRWVAVAAVLLAVIVVVVVVLLASGSSPHHPAGMGVPAGQTTAEVTRRTLTESSTVDGTLGYGATLELYDRLSGTFTWLPAVGTTIGRGGTLWRVNNQPVALMYGSVPAYRTLEQGVSDGPDVTELNENLIDLGYDPYGAIVDDEDFSEATAAAVRRWQHAEGLPETGKVELGRVVFAPGARRVTAVKVVLGQDPPGEPGEKDPGVAASETTGPGKGAGSEHKDRVPKEKPSVQKNLEKPGPTNSRSNTSAPNTSPSNTSPPNNPNSTPNNPNSNQPNSKQPTSDKPSSETPATSQPAKKEPSSKAPAAKEPAVSKEPAAKDPSGGKDEPEGGAGAGMVVLDATPTQQLVTLKLKAEQQTLARVGELAPVTLPGDQVVQGRIVEVGSVAEVKESDGGEKSGSPGGESESATIPVTLALEHPVAHLDEAPVSVELVKSVRHEVLTVPATALTATAGGGYAIETLQDGRRVALTVTPGMFADGYVQVEGTGVHEGLTVIQSE